MSKDNDDLRLLSIFHYVVGGIGCLFGCMPLIHVGFGTFFLLSPEVFSENGGQAPPELFGWMFVVIGLCFFCVAQAIAISTIMSGRFIAKRKNYLFSFIIGCIECTFFPFGTVLGVFTIIVLSRESVKAIYEKSSSPGAHQP